MAVLRKIVLNNDDLLLWEYKRLILKTYTHEIIIFTWFSIIYCSSSDIQSLLSKHLTWQKIAIASELQPTWVMQVGYLQQIIWYILTQLLATLLQEFVIPMCLMNLTNRELNKEKKRVVLFTATVNIWITPCATSGK